MKKLRMRWYRRRDACAFTAVQWTGCNLKHIEAWVRRVGKLTKVDTHVYSDNALIVSVSSGSLMLRPSDWIIYDGTSFQLTKEFAFSNMYEEVPAPDRVTSVRRRRRK